MNESDAERSAPRVEVLRGEATPEEVAAVIAVVTESYVREAAAAVVEQERRRSAWEVSTRGLRAPLRREVCWGRFAG